MKKKELLERIKALESRVLLLEAHVGALRNAPVQPITYPPIYWEPTKTDPFDPPYKISYGQNSEDFMGNMQDITICASPTIAIEDNGRLTIREEETYKKADLKLVT